MRCPVLLISFIVFFCTDLSAQDSIAINDSLKKNRPQKVLFGFSIGSLSPVVRSPEFDIYQYEANDGLPDTISNMSVRGNGGWQVGLMLEMRLHEKLFMRLNPGVSISTGLVYTYDDPEARKKRSVRFEMVEVPVNFLYKLPGKKITTIVIGGMSLKSHQRARWEDPVRYALANVGLGIEKKIGKFIFSPELRYSIALTSATVLRTNSNPFWVDRMRLDTFGIVLCFKG